jgi:hypothetical protein
VQQTDGGGERAGVDAGSSAVCAGGPMWSPAHASVLIDLTLFDHSLRPSLPLWPHCLFGLIASLRVSLISHRMHAAHVTLPSWRAIDPPANSRGLPAWAGSNWRTGLTARTGSVLPFQKAQMRTPREGVSRSGAVRWQREALKGTILGQSWDLFGDERIDSVPRRAYHRPAHSRICSGRSATWSPARGFGVKAQLDFARGGRANG